MPGPWRDVPQAPGLGLIAMQTFSAAIGAAAALLAFAAEVVRFFRQRPERSRREEAEDES